MNYYKKKNVRSLQQSGNVVSNVSLGYRTPYLKRKSFYPGIKITKVYLIYFMYGSWKQSGIHKK